MISTDFTLLKCSALENWTFAINAEGDLVFYDFSASCGPFPINRIWFYVRFTKSEILFDFFVFGSFSFELRYDLKYQR